MKMMFDPLWDDPESTSGTADTIPTRDKIPVADTWNLEDLYSTPDAWERDFSNLPQLCEPVLSFRGRLSSTTNVLACFQTETALDRTLNKLYAYAHMKADEDTADTANRARESRIRSRYSEVAASLAWIRPELLANDEAVLAEWADDPALVGYRYQLIRLLREKSHVLGDAEEQLLAGAGPIFGAPGEVFKILSNADLVFPAAISEDGEEKPMSQGRFLSYLISPDRCLRKSAFNSMYEAFGSVRNTVACTLQAHVKMHNFMAHARRYESALSAALVPDNVPVALYETLIETAHNALPALHRYVALRKRVLGLDDLDMFDMYVPIVPAMDAEIPFADACSWVLEACRPLGDAYVDILASAFENRWIDRYENRGKRSGAYSGGCYDSLPYVLLNYNGTFDDAFTLAHELGHSMHSWFANQQQPPQTADYPIFLAEIASTLNEALLLDYLQKTRGENPKFRAYLLNHFCDGFRGTVYRQTMFAEFEKHVHELDRAGQALTPDVLGEYYYDLNSRYYGPDVSPDPQIALEWARIPHFYYNFYVYKYATSFCASQLFYQRVLSGTSERDSYLGLLQAGGSGDPLDLIQNAGVDLLDADVLSGAFAHFGEMVDELDALL